jgi:hypothetical protein
MTEENGSVGYDALRNVPHNLQIETTFRPNSAYEAYLRMHKVLVGPGTADFLIDTAETLKREELPRYLTVAGSAAVEAALVKPDRPTRQRMKLLDTAESCWQRALAGQIVLNTGEEEHLFESAAPYRTALNLATLPLVRGLVVGDVTDKTCQAVLEDSLRVAQANIVRLELAAREDDIESLGEHIGFGYECNALLSLNRALSNSWFALPSLARADTGYHYSEQTHDLMVIRQKRGTIQNILPVEVKSSASLRDRNRFEALLVRGKMHLSVEGGHFPSVTLQAITATHEGTATKKQLAITQSVTNRFMRMLKDYYAGERKPVATTRTITSFHDKTLVIQNHPGLSPVAA